MAIKRQDIELMAPAGSYESLMAAINVGADSVYFGAGNLNMRARSSANFTIKDIQKISEICKSHNVKSYLTLNIVAYDSEMNEILDIINSAKESGISAIIASDMAVINYCREKNIEVHASTQLNISNTEALKFYGQFCDVIVLARELSLEQVGKISEEIFLQKITGPSGNPVKLEMFIHGALCMSISGKCYLSLHEHNYSANRGECLQPCRRKYEVKDIETGNKLIIDNEYIMSPKDLCTIKFLDKILNTGVSVLKIEGRGRSPEYVKVVTEAYNKALQMICEDNYNIKSAEILENKLKEVFNRGFWDGYYLGQRLGEWTDRYGSSATKKKIYIGKVTHYYPKIGVAVVKIENSYLIVGDEISINGITTGVYSDIVREIRLNDEIKEKCVKGDLISIPVYSKVRVNDKIYKIIMADRQ
jgi:U32 family peptidase